MSVNFSLFVLILLNATSAQGQVQVGCGENTKWGSLVLDPSDRSCQSYLWCLNRTLALKCPGNLVFDPRYSVCNWRFAAGCFFDQPEIPPTTPESKFTTEQVTATAQPTITKIPSTTKESKVTTEQVTTTTQPITKIPATTTETVTFTTSKEQVTTTTQPKPYVDPCTLPGAGAFYPDRDDCSFYIQCSNGKGIRRACGPGLVWNQQGVYCDWPANVDCVPGSIPTPSTDNKDGSNDPNDTPGQNDGSSTANPVTADPSDENRTYPTPPGNSSNAGDCKRIVCYFTNWAQYRPQGGKFVPENIESGHCTHIIYAFAKLNGNQLAAYEWNDDSTPWMTGMYARVMKLKSANPELKVLLGVGGWNMGSPPFTRMVATKGNRKEFIDTGIKFLRDRNFDGLDLDWEYPANRGSPWADRGRFSLLLKETREAFENEARATQSPRLLLAAAVAAGKSTIDTAYDIPELAKYLDFANLMSYDLHGAWDAVTGHNSPLYPGPWEFGAERYLNVDWAARYWVQKGFPKHNLVVGVPFYGRTFTLAGSNSGVKAPARGAGSAGRYTRESGFVSYYEVCDYLKLPSAVSRRIDEMRVPYLVKDGKEWIGYDDPQSLTTKVEYIVQNSYGGVMIWSIAMDDFQGQFCGQGKFPLMRTVRQGCGLEA